MSKPAGLIQLNFTPKGDDHVPMKTAGKVFSHSLNPWSTSKGLYQIALGTIQNSQSIVHPLHRENRNTGYLSSSIILT
jgi:hypothetical protein